MKLRLASVSDRQKEISKGYEGGLNSPRGRYYPDLPLTNLQGPRAEPWLAPLL
jgi:hypothetical protein